MEPQLILGAALLVWILLASLGAHGHRWAAYLAAIIVLVVWALIALLMALIIDGIGHPWCNLSVRPGTACTEWRRVQLVCGCGVFVLVCAVVVFGHEYLQRAGKRAEFIANYNRYILHKE